MVGQLGTKKAKTRKQSMITGQRLTTMGIATLLVAALFPMSGMGLDGTIGDDGLGLNGSTGDDLSGLSGEAQANLDTAQALHTLSQDGTPSVEDVFDLHVQRVQAVDSELAGELDSLLEQQRSNLVLVHGIQAIEGADHADDLARDFEVIAAATSWQATTLGVSLETVAPHSHVLPSQAAFALAERHDVPVSPEQQDQLLALDELPAPQRDALVAVINGFLALDDATHMAYEGADLERLVELRDAYTPGEFEGLPDEDHTSLVDAGVEVGLILGTRTQFLATVMEFQRAWEDFSLPTTATTTAASSGPGIDLCPALAFDLDGLDTLYEDNCALVVDVGGDDTFLNNAGGSKLVGAPENCSITGRVSGAAALVNLAGNDQYISEGDCGVNGGGTEGVGFLYDAGGNDTYTAGDRGTNGGGFLGGVGFLYDAGGNDIYTAGNIGTNGGGYLGVGFLYDADGDDTYTAGSSGTNGGGYLGVGFLYDAGGNDTYTAGNIGTNGGGRFGRVGFLYDADSDDIYTAGHEGTNGGGNGGVGFLLDGGGIDRFEDDGYVCDNRDTEDCTLVPKGTVGALIDSVPLSDGVEDSEYAQRELLSVENQTVVPGEGTDPTPLPPEDVDGQDTPDYPGTDPQEIPDYPGTDEFDPGFGSVRVHDSEDQAFLCVSVNLNVPDEEPDETEITCVNRVWLGPADGLIERGEMPLVYVPGTDSQDTPDVPGTDPQDTPNVPGVDEGDLGTVPSLGTSHYEASVTASYWYDAERVEDNIILTLLGEPVYAPFGPGDTTWFTEDGEDTALQVTVTLYEDGEHATMQTITVPFLGQLLAALEYTAGTMP